jgi:tetratricopeptide (TPR) repeat protein
MGRGGIGRKGGSWWRCGVLATAFWLCLAVASGAGAANPSEPAAIAALRADQTRTAAQLEAQAARLRASTADPRFRAWATLAEAEFANDQEHADEAMAGLDQAIAQADALKLPDLRFEALIRLSTVLVNRGRSKDTEAVLAKMQAMVEAGGNTRWRAQWLHERGVLERKLGRFEQARALFVQARALFHGIGDPVMEAREMNSIGNLDGRTGRFSDAVAMHSDALTMARKAGDKAETARSLRMLGVLYLNLDDEELASRYLLEALDYVEERNRREAIALHGELIGTFTRLEKLTEAEYHGQQAVRLAELSGSHPNRVNAFTRMAELRLLQGRIDEAEQWVARANESRDHVAVRDRSLIGISRMRVLAARDRTAAALKEADAVLADVRDLGDRILERSVLDLMSELQLRAGDAASAFATRKAHQKLDKELAIDVAARRIALLESSLERERAKTERELLQRDNDIQALRLNRQRLIAIALLVGLATVLVVSALLYARYRSTLRHRNELRASRDALERRGQYRRTDRPRQPPRRRACAGRTPGPHSRTADGDAARSRRVQAHQRQPRPPGRRCGAAGSGDAHARRVAGGRAAGRWGGEEFIAILDGAPGREPASVAEAMRAALAAAPVLFEGTAIPVTVSIGVATAFAADGIDTLLAEADAALYRAKGAGRNSRGLRARAGRAGLSLSPRRAGGTHRHPASPGNARDARASSAACSVVVTTTSSSCLAQRLAEEIDHRAVAAVMQAIAIGADAVHRRHVAEVLDRTRAQQRLPRHRRAPTASWRRTAAGRNPAARRSTSKRLRANTGKRRS